MLLLDGAEGTKKITGQNAADGLLGLSGGAKKSELVDVSSSKYINWNSSGWHRIFSISFTPNDITTYPPKLLNIQCIIRRDWGNGGNEVHCFQILNSTTAFVIEPIYDFGTYSFIKKVRFYILKGEKDRLCCDVLYDGSTLMQNRNPFATFLSNIDRLTYGSNIYFPTSEELVSDEIDTSLTTGWYYERAFKANSWMGSEDSWPLT